MVEYQRKDSVLSLNVPSDKILLRTIRAEQPCEPFIKGNVRKATLFSNRLCVSRFSSSDGAFNEVDLWHRNRLQVQANAKVTA